MCLFHVLFFVVNIKGNYIKRERESKGVFVRLYFQYKYNLCLQIGDFYHFETNSKALSVNLQRPTFDFLSNTQRQTFLLKLEPKKNSNSLSFVLYEKESYIEFSFFFCKKDFDKASIPLSGTEGDD